MAQSGGEIERLLEIMAQLRHPDDGCPWDLEQTFSSIVPHTIEEAYEVAAAAESDDIDALRDELGDLLFQVVFLSRIAHEQGKFDFFGVVDAICEKLLRRHPHVFGNEQYVDHAALAKRWDEAKEIERRAKQADGVPASALDDVPQQLPATTRAQKLQRRAARVGFDWRSAADVFEKLDEEIGELREAMAAGESAAIFHEMGDLLLTCTNLARKLEIDGESALRAANGRFEQRFRGMEALAADRGEALVDLDSATLETYWTTAKKAAK